MNLKIEPLPLEFLYIYNFIFDEYYIVKKKKIK